VTRAVVLLFAALLNCELRPLLCLMVGGAQTGDGLAGAWGAERQTPTDLGRRSAALETRVLLVDDDDAVRNALRRVLEHRGYRVVSCSSGSEALEQLAGGGYYDAMVSDVRMPGMSGLRLLRSVREHDLDLPVILVTGNPDLGSATEAVEHGAFQYLIKPIESDRLDEVVERAAAIGRMACVKREYVEEFGSATFRVGDKAGSVATLERALGSLWLAFQPIFDAKRQTLFAYEALMRSEEPELPNPLAVLKAAERTERLPELGYAVRRLAAQGIAAGGDAVFFVNLHPEDLRDENLYDPSAPLTSFASRVVLEITERASLEQFRDLRERVARLRELGFRIALDDLGAGYAGLTSFTQLEPEFVKLDMELIRGIHKHDMKRKIVRSMVELCHDMGKLIIAEGVEVPEEQRVLVDLDCDLLQGFLLAPPSRYPKLALV
jgi:EAL domain-containing protein (putative c-di-GMP-specific phosphodiesterase class I)/ActR/RegA family two-component response regulator